MLKLLKKLIAKKPQSIYGPGIFYQRTWLSRQVDEALYQQTKKKVFGVD